MYIYFLIFTQIFAKDAQYPFLSSIRSSNVCWIRSLVNKVQFYRSRQVMLKSRQLWSWKWIFILWTLIRAYSLEHLVALQILFAWHACYTSSSSLSSSFIHFRYTFWCFCVILFYRQYMYIEYKHDLNVANHFNSFGSQ